MGLEEGLLGKTTGERDSIRLSIEPFCTTAAMVGISTFTTNLTGEPAPISILVLPYLILGQYSAHKIWRQVLEP